MATDSYSELTAFHDFLGKQIVGGHCDLTPEESLELWRVEHPTAEELELSIAAINAALADVAAGDQGRPAKQVIAEARQRYELD